MPQSDMARAEAFLAEFVEKLTSNNPGSIDYVFVGGSAVRNDFVLGESDIDMVVNVNNPEDIQKVRASGDKIFWELNKKHSMKLVEAHKKRARDGFGFLLRETAVRPPTFNIRCQKTPPPRKGTIFHAFDPIHRFSKSLVYNASLSGRILYDAHPQQNRFKAGNLRHGKGVVTYHLLSSLIALVFFPLMPDKSYWHAVRMVLFEFQPELNGLGNPPRIALDALYAKKYRRELAAAITFPEKIIFILRVPPTILASNICSPIHVKPANGR